MSTFFLLISTTLLFLHQAKFYIAHCSPLCHPGNYHPWCACVTLVQFPLRITPTSAQTRWSDFLARAISTFIRSLPMLQEAHWHHYVVPGLVISVIPSALYWFLKIQPRQWHLHHVCCCRPNPVSPNFQWHSVTQPVRWQHGLFSFKLQVYGQRRDTNYFLLDEQCSCRRENFNKKRKSSDRTCSTSAGPWIS